jgi:hypothetical protein
MDLVPKTRRLQRGIIYTVCDSLASYGDRFSQLTRRGILRRAFVIGIFVRVRSWFVPLVPTIAWPPASTLTFPTTTCFG